MDPERFEEVERLYHSALEREPVERAAYIKGACSGDEELRREVESLLSTKESSVHYIEGLAGREAARLFGASGDLPAPIGSRPAYIQLAFEGSSVVNAEVEKFFVEGSRVSPTEFVHGPSPSPERIGPYRILEKLGEGGMGVVYLADQIEPIRRRVALKVIRLGMDTKGVIARFEAEGQALALMNHPSIACVYEVGATEDGRPYFTMEAVHGVPITEYCDRHKLSLRQRLEIFLQVCQGVEHAHHTGIIHRDLKPSNILVATPDKGPLAKIIDFGIAKATNQRLTEKTIYTELGCAVGTPQYMSPEQAERTAEDIDYRTDIYSLGMVLYELLVGELPLDWEALSKAALDEVLRRIREDEPPTPSTRWSRLNLERTAMLAASRRTSPSAVRNEIRGDLDWITMKAIDKDRERRYRTAAHLEEDIRRHLQGEPVLAGPPSTLYRLKKYVRKHKPAVLSAGAVILALAAGLLASILFALDARKNAADASDNLDLAEKNEASAKGFAAEASARLEEVLRLADVKRLQEYLAEADDLWPSLPESAPPMEARLKKAEVLAARLETHRSTLLALREKGLPYGEAARAADWKRSPQAPKHEDLLQERSAIEKDIAELEEKFGREPKATLLSFGDDPKNKPIASCFRHAFDTGDLPKPEKLKLRLTADDGAVVYLNGKEVLRVRLPAGAVSSETPASETVWEPAAEDHEVPAEALAGSKNILSVEVHQASGQSSDLRLEVELLAGEKALVPAGALWRYSAVGKPVPSNWLAPDIDDSSWQEGSAPLGYGFKDGPGRLLELKKDIEKLKGDISKLEEDSKRRTWRFAETEIQWQHDTVAGLVEGLERFSDLDPRKSAIASVKKRLEFASTVERRTIDDYRDRWTDATASIADPQMCPRYRGLKIQPQVGLIPIGRDLESGLWEFAHLETGQPAERGADGKLILTEETGLVFVLLAGGTFRMGAERPGPEKPAGSPNLDPEAWPNESPVHEVALDAFFHSKYEMTQGQWRRFTGENPSYYGPGYEIGGHATSLLHPVEQVSWEMCDRTLRRLGLILPTEAQWEYACRGGTASVWWTGDARESLRGKVNLADQAAARAGAPWQALNDWPELDDSYAIHAPVGSYAPNPFGLHEVHGNVWEWCRDGDGSDDYKLPVMPSDGERRGGLHAARNRVFRGGSFIDSVALARSAVRIFDPPTFQSNNIGVRPAKVIPK